MQRYFLLFLFFLLFNTLAVNAFEIPEKPAALVNDYAGTLSQPEATALNRKLMNYMDSTSTQIFVVLLNEDEGKPIEMMGAEIGEKWGVGQKGKDNGVVVLMYPDERKVTIQTGYGLEEFIPDALAKRIIQNEMIPSFKSGNYAQGLDKGTDVIMKLLSGQFTGEQYRKQTSSSGSPFGILMLIVLFFIFFGQSRRRRYGSVGRSLPFWLALSMLGGRGSAHGGSWGGFSSGSGGFGGGFSGGGGGSFGGGGASGSW